MTMMELLVLLVIAGFCGAIGEAISGFSHLGCLSSVALGFIGALIGTWLARALELPQVFSLKFGDIQSRISFLKTQRQRSANLQRQY